MWGFLTTTERRILQTADAMFGLPRDLVLGTPDARAARRPQVGETLVAKGVLTPAQMDAVLDRVFGDLAAGFPRPAAPAAPLGDPLRALADAVGRLATRVATARQPAPAVAAPPTPPVAAPATPPVAVPAATRPAPRPESARQAHARRRAEILARPTGLSGRSTGLSLPDLLQLLHRSRVTGTLHVRTPDASESTVSLVEGEAVNAGVGPEAGEVALVRLLARERADFDFVPGPPRRTRTIARRLDALLVDAMRLATTSHGPRPTGGLRVWAGGAAAA